jgi:hypothetical protein
VRLSNHDISLELEIDRSPSAEPALSTFPLGLVLDAVTNLIDNSVYWLSSRWPEDEGPPNRKVLIAVDTDAHKAPTLILADNGPGFVDDLEDATEPLLHT